MNKACIKAIKIENTKAYIIRDNDEYDRYIVTNLHECSEEEKIIIILAKDEK